MSAGDIDVMNAALLRYRERLAHLLDLVAKDEAYSIIALEPHLIVTQGPERYLSCLDSIADAGVRADLDVHLDRTLTRILDDPDDR